HGGRSPGRRRKPMRPRNDRADPTRRHHHRVRHRTRQELIRIALLLLALALFALLLYFGDFLDALP
ncbi:MAG TPA: hypothetical protein VKA84_05725, partial [Gemmatimonadaceae bacterium]|nr:hypothetical protein [Gemmatimonadaceae bacterium]